EALWPVRDHPGARLVALARELSCRPVIAEMNPGCRHGDDRRRDARLVHLVERALEAPIRDRRLITGRGTGAAERDQRVLIDLRDEMVMDVDAMRRGHPVTL